VIRESTKESSRSRLLSTVKKEESASGLAGSFSYRFVFEERSPDFRQWLCQLTQTAGEVLFSHSARPKSPAIQSIELGPNDQQAGDTCSTKLRSLSPNFSSQICMEYGFVLSRSKTGGER